MDVNSASDNILLLKSILDDLSCKFYLGFGTLLGLYRDGKLIPYDYDSDFIVLPDEYETIAKNVPRFEQAGFTLLRHDPGSILSFSRKGSYTDIYPFYLVDGEYQNGGYRIRLIQFEGERFLEALGTSWRVFAHPELFLERQYGKDWKYPVTGVSAGNVPNRKDYWENFYKGNSVVKTPSDFAVFCYENFIAKQPGKLADIGCGNFRDSDYFMGKGLEVISIDQIAADRIGYLKCSVSRLPDLSCRHYYLRWLFHALRENEENDLLNWLARRTGTVYVECRSDQEPIVGNHFRRLINLAELKHKFSSLGFKLECVSEGRGMSKIDGDDPLLIRLVASK